LQLLTDLTQIAAVAAANENENDAFRIFLKQQDIGTVDAIVHEVNAVVTPQIDCTQCGNCCRSLMINVTPEETLSLAVHLKEKIEVVKEKYIEISSEGQMIVNTIPCHFLANSSCTIYENRFTECREFPHLHKENFTGRLFGTLMYYALCPIIFNVVESLKEKLEFKY
jgi:Fe-S-cluster containining protein